MSGAVTDPRGAAAPTPGDGRPKEPGNLVDREFNGMFENVYLYTLNAAGSGTRIDLRKAVGVTRYAVSATTTHTATNATIILTGASTAQTIPVPAANGDRLIILNNNAGTNTVTASANKIYDQGTTTASPAAQTTVSLKGVGAFIDLIGINSLWWTHSGTLDAEGTDAIAVTYA